MAAQLINYRDEALRAVTEATGILVDSTHPNSLFIQIGQGENRRRVDFHVKSIPNLKDHQLNSLLVNAPPQNMIYLIGTIPRTMRDQLAEHRINYIDAAGNCFIQELNQGIFINREGNKSVPVPPLGKFLYNKSGLRVLFTLLTQSDALNLTLRELAKRTGLSLGITQVVMNDFKRAGFVVRTDLAAKQVQLAGVSTLTEQWVSRYEERLKPGLFVGRFRLPSGLTPADWRTIPLQAGSLWGGEAAAEALTNYLRPASLTIYSEESQAGLMKKYRLIPDSRGNVEVYRTFWSLAHQPMIADVPVVPPLLIYADLLASIDPRVVGTATEIHQKYVQHQF